MVSSASIDTKVTIVSATHCANRMYRCLLIGTDESDMWLNKGSFTQSLSGRVRTKASLMRIEKAGFLIRLIAMQKKLSFSREKFCMSSQGFVTSRRVQVGVRDLPSFSMQLGKCSDDLI